MRESAFIIDIDYTVPRPGIEEGYLTGGEAGYGFPSAVDLQAQLHPAHGNEIPVGHRRFPGNFPVVELGSVAPAVVDDVEQISLPENLAVPPGDGAVVIHADVHIPGEPDAVSYTHLTLPTNSRV